MSEHLMPWFTSLMPAAWRGEATVIALASLVALLLLYRFHIPSRRSLRPMMVACIVAVLGLHASGLLSGEADTTTLVILGEGSAVLLGLLLIRLWIMLLFRLLMPLFGVIPPRILEDIGVAAGYLTWGLILLRQAGLDLSSIVTTSAVITAVLAFSMQDTIGNLLAGLALQLDRSVDLGDWIKLEDVVGRVVGINWRATSVETRNWETVVIPNSVLLKQKFTILGKRLNEPTQWRRWVTFNVNWETLPTQIIQMIEASLLEAHIPNVAQDPAPNCVLMGFETGYSQYAVRYWLTNLYFDDPTDSAVRAHIDAALRRHGLRMAAPHYNLLTTKENEKYYEARHKRHTEERLAILNEIDLFADLNAEERVHLAEHLKFTPFVAGDIIMHQGQVAHWLYILLKGEVEVWTEEEGKRLLADVLGPGNIVGEMGLLIGEARSATVIARSTVECFRVDKEAFQTILDSRKELAEALSHILEKRQAERQEKLGLYQAQVTEEQGYELVDKVLRFFGLTRG
jgi:small-conductance mechanosensitive channel